MNTTYDVIVLGTGLKECMLAGLLAKFPKKTPGEEKKEGAKILQLDRNGYYGSDSASLNLTNLWKHFRPNTEVPKQYGENRDWNVDLIPKYIMANGSLVKLLLKTNVSQYLEWKAVDGTCLNISNGKQSTELSSTNSTKVECSPKPKALFTKCHAPQPKPSNRVLWALSKRQGLKNS